MTLNGSNQRIAVITVGSLGSNDQSRKSEDPVVSGKIGRLGSGLEASPGSAELGAAAPSSADPGDASKPEPNLPIFPDTTGSSDFLL